MIEDLLAKNPLDRPDNARAVAIRLGLADHEIAGLALGLAQAVYGESTLDDDTAALALVSDPAPQEPAPTVAVDRASLLED